MAQVKHIAMFVKDADATAAFYEKALGLRKTAERISTVVIKARVVDMTDGSLTITLICPDDPGEHRDWVYKTWGVNHIGFIVDDFYGTIAKLRELGVDAPEKPDRPIFKFIDPNGTEIDVASRDWKEWDFS